MLARYRGTYQRLFSGVGRVMAKTGLSPNAFTILSLLPAAAAGYYLYRGDVWMGLALILVTSFVDVLDGNVARATGKVSVYGKVLDHTVDRYVEFIFIGGIVAGGLATPFAGFVGISGMIMASFIRAKAESEGARGCDVGLMDRAEKLLILMAGCALYPRYDLSIEYALILIGVLSHITVVQRARFAQRQFEESS